MEMARFATIANEPREKKVRFLPGQRDPKVFLEAVVADADLCLRERMRAAVELLPYIHPKLMVTAQVSEQSFAELLEKRIKKFEQMNGKTPQVIEHTQTQVEPRPQIEAPTDARPNHPITNDRRFRRL
jgi:hypothetical protein